MTLFDNEDIRCRTCAFWQIETIRQERGACGFEPPPWMTRGDDGDRHTHEDEFCGFWEEKES